MSKRTGVPTAKLDKLLQGSLALLKDYAGGPRLSAGEPVEIPSLLQQCQLVLKQAQPPEPVRLLHHLACTGGTMISKCIAAQANAVLVSEIDPLSTLSSVVPYGATYRWPTPKPPFRPTDMIIGLRTSLRPVPEATLVKVFVASLEALRADLESRGQYAVIRDHSHSQFCTQQDPDGRPTLHEMVAAAMPYRSVVTVRHPLDSFLSLSKLGWQHFSPSTLDEYCHRYHKFLDRHEGIRIFQYEAITQAPEQELSELMDCLELPFNPLTLDVFSVIAISGDSGRKGNQIGPRSRREVPGNIQSEISDSSGFHTLCERLGYAVD